MTSFRNPTSSAEEHGRYAFQVDHAGDFNSLHEAIEDEAARIARDDSTHPDKGFNVEKKDLKRAKRALAEYTPGASQADLLAVAWEDFRRHSADAWAPYDTPENVAILSNIAKDKKISVASAFYSALEANILIQKIRRVR